MSETERTTIPIEEPGRAWYAGLAAGSRTADALADNSAATDHDQRLAYFWLSVGRHLANDYPQASEEQTVLYLKGAGMRAPSDRRAVLVTIDSVDNAAFGRNDEDEVDEDDARREIAHILKHAANTIGAGEDEGRLYDTNGNAVGHFKVNLYG